MDQRPNNYNNGPNGNGSGGGNGPGSPKNKSSLLVLLICILATLLIWTVFSNIMEGSTSKEITYDKFIEMLDEGKVQSVELQDGMLTIVPREQKVEGIEFQYSTAAMEDSTALIARLTEAEEKNDQDITFNEINDPTGSVIYTIITLIVPFIILIILMNWLMKKMSILSQGGGVGKSKAKAYVQKETGVTFKDVAGEDEAKESLQEVVDFLHNPAKYTEIGAKLPKGALLVGPPGTGKTLLAKAVAGEAHVPFFSLSGSDFVEMFVGVGASRVRDLFEEGKKHRPCIIFIDEIDAVARRRGTGMGGGHDEREQTLNQLLVEMDGFGANEGIIVMAATNRVDILDPAILRPGRFDRRVMVGAPDVKGREEILKVHSKGKPLGDDVDLAQIAQTTAGFTGAELENLLNEAAILAAKENRVFLKQEDIKRAFIKVGIGTEKHSRVISEKEKRITAFHEAGHAILFHVLDQMEPVYTISIIPTGLGAAGYTMPLPSKDEMFNTRGKMLENIQVCLGGRIAEELVFDDITTGASQDIKQATQIAKAMVTKYGMSSTMGMVAYSDDESEVFIGRDLAHARGISEVTAAGIDSEVKAIIDECYEKAKAIIKKYEYVLYACAELLMEKEKIGNEEFTALFHTEKNEGSDTEIVQNSEV